MVKVISDVVECDRQDSSDASSSEPLSFFIGENNGHETTRGGETERFFPTVAESLLPNGRAALAQVAGNSVEHPKCPPRSDMKCSPRTEVKCSPRRNVDAAWNSVIALELSKALAQEMKKAAKDVSKKPKVRTTAVGAIGGAAVGGGTGTCTGAVTGAAVGSVCGLPMAIFTFGLSIPICAAAGTVVGAGTGAAVGGTTGFWGGGTAGYAYSCWRARRGDGAASKETALALEQGASAPSKGSAPPSEDLHTRTETQMQSVESTSSPPPGEDLHSRSETQLQSVESTSSFEPDEEPPQSPGSHSQSAKRKEEASVVKASTSKAEAEEAAAGQPSGRSRRKAALNEFVQRSHAEQVASQQVAAWRAAWKEVENEPADEISESEMASECGDESIADYLDEATSSKPVFADKTSPPRIPLLNFSSLKPHVEEAAHQNLTPAAAVRTETKEISIPRSARLDSSRFVMPVIDEVSPQDETAELEKIYADREMAKRARRVQAQLAEAERHAAEEADAAARASELGLPAFTKKVVEAVVEGEVAASRRSEVATAKVVSALQETEVQLVEFDEKTLTDAASEWIEDITDVVMTGSLFETLRTGEVLCHLINCLKPGVIDKIERPGISYNERVNINCFIKACRALGVPEYAIFSIDDLYENKSMPSVVRCIHALGSAVQRTVPDFKGPHLGRPDSLWRDSARHGVGDTPREGRLRSDSASFTPRCFTPRVTASIPRTVTPRKATPWSIAVPQKGCSLDSGVAVAPRRAPTKVREERCSVDSGVAVPATSATPNFMRSDMLESRRLGQPTTASI